MFFSAGKSSTPRKSTPWIGWYHFTSVTRTSLTISYQSMAHITSDLQCDISQLGDTAEVEVFFEGTWWFWCQGMEGPKFLPTQTHHGQTSHCTCNSKLLPQFQTSKSLDQCPRFSLFRPGVTSRGTQKRFGNTAWWEMTPVKASTIFCLGATKKARTADETIGCHFQKNHSGYNHL